MAEETVRVAVRVRPFNARFAVIVSIASASHPEHAFCTRPMIRSSKTSQLRCSALTNTREKERGAKLCIDMRGNTTTIFDVNDPEKSKRDFTFDFSYWSHDAFHIDANGVAVPDSDRYADQKRVFLDLGQGVLKNAFGGIIAMVCVLFDIL